MNNRLNVALYGMFPDSPYMADVLESRWRERHPGVQLQFQAWDSYTEDPPDDADVFEFDPMFLEYFADRGYLAELPKRDIADLDDILPFALRGAVFRDVLYAVPHLATSPVLFYREGDTAVARARSMEELFDILGPSHHPTPRPPRGEGLLVNYSSALSSATFYLEATTREAGPAMDLPCGEILEQRAIGENRLLFEMAGRAQAMDTAREAQRIQWFAEGFGRAYFDMLERPYFLPPDQLAGLCVRYAPLAPEGREQRSWTTMVALGAHVPRDRRELALELLNLYTSAGVVMASLFPPGPGWPRAQYLLPVRQSVLAAPELAHRGPFYAKLRELLRQPQVVSRLGPHCRRWWFDAPPRIQARIVGEKDRV